MYETVICGALHPDLGERFDMRGESLSPVTCTASVRLEGGARLEHRGAHRARLLKGVVLRWTAEVSA